MCVQWLFKTLKENRTWTAEHHRFRFRSRASDRRVRARAILYCPSTVETKHTSRSEERTLGKQSSDDKTCHFRISKYLFSVLTEGPWYSVTCVDHWVDTLNATWTRSQKIPRYLMPSAWDILVIVSTPHESERNDFCLSNRLHSSKRLLFAGS